MKIVLVVGLAILIAFPLGYAFKAYAEIPKMEKIGAPEALEKVNSGALLVDVRTPEEFNAGHISAAININSVEAEAHINLFGLNKEREIVLYCKSGGRAGKIAEMLKARGFSRVSNAGGYEDLKKVF